MKKNNENNQKDENGKRDGVHPSRRRRLGIVRLGLLGLMMMSHSLTRAQTTSGRAPQT